MRNLQKMGGVTALVHSAAYLVGIGMYLTVLSPILDAPPDQYVALLGDYQSTMYIWIFIAYLVSSFCLIVVSLALHEQLKASSPAMIQTATVIGFIWAGLIIASGNIMLHGFGQVADIYSHNPAQAETVRLALTIVENGIVSAHEFTGGVWILLLSWVAFRAGTLPRSLSVFGLIIGIAGIVSLVPPLAEIAVTTFGLSMIIWFAWLGIVLLRRSPTVEIKKLDAFVPRQTTP